jgi:hypothetical protein
MQGLLVFIIIRFIAGAISANGSPFRSLAVCSNPYLCLVLMNVARTIWRDAMDEQDEADTKSVLAG